MGAFLGTMGRLPPWSLPTRCQGGCLPGVRTIQWSVNLDKYLPIDVGPRVLPRPLETDPLSREEHRHHHMMPVSLPLGPVPFRASVCTYLYVVHTAQLPPGVLFVGNIGQAQPEG